MFSGHKKSILFILLGIAAIVSAYSYFIPRIIAKRMAGDRTKILFIGLDGASWNVIQPLIKENKLPNIKRLVDTGCWGNLESLHPPVNSEVIWTTIATGKTPEKNGITVRLIEDRDTGRFVPITSNFRKCKALWNILSDSDKNVGVVGYWVTWPPEEIRGGIIVPDRLYNLNYPAEGYIFPALTRLCSQAEFEKFKDTAGPDSFDSMVREAKKRDAFVSNFAGHLESKEKFDFLAVCLLGTDWLSHLFWKYLEPQGLDVSKDQIKTYADIIKNYYIYCDKIIGDLVKKTDKDTIVVVVSDHGFKKGEKTYFFNGLNYLLELCGLSKIRINSKTAWIREPSGGDIWTKEKSIRIFGQLSDKEIGVLQNEIKRKLNQIRIDENNQPLFDLIQDAKAGLIVVLNLDYIKLHLDCHLIINNKTYNIFDFLTTAIFSGNHSDFGIIIISGRNIKRGIIEPATVYDVAPTVLYLMGLPVPKDMDGKVLVGSIKTNFLTHHPVKYIESYETRQDKKDRSPIPSPMDEKIKERMRSLGYIN